MAKAAIVTGAGRGVGRAVCVELARAGYGVVGVSRTSRELDDTGREVAALGGRFVAVQGDLGAGETVEAVGEALVRRCVTEFGGVGAVVHCAAIAPLSPVEQTPVGDFRRVLEVNVVGGYAVVRAAWEELKKTGRGAVVMISSYASRDPFTGFSAYAASKAGINLLTLALDREGKPHGLRCYAVAPGAVETGMLRAIVSTDQYPPEKTLSPGAVAAVVVQCVEGALVHCGGETIFMSRQ